MDEKLYALLKDQSFWSWLPREGGAYFDACFHMDWETVPTGEVRQSRGRMGYLISGRAHLEGSGGLVHAAGGEIFGIVQPGRRETRRAEETSLRAVTECRVVWLDGDVLTSVCYAACWFHARLIREVDQWFETNK